ncbi:TPA: hypothetical protein PXE26_000742 [Mannheimia haemolytica]|nr:hypothetical protein [Mannheimia haemolytica]AGK01778.1 hypothetical protein MHH_c13270 [Mannheimia haemolytica M42548]AGQ26579.1 hypothetical protein F382_11745 [Mannheimia haemolytica D153]AGQ39507.1 hypothetical protein J450_10425 [Mannheimia haemolytica D171]AGQ42122.1 hypothetical protein J451_11855 [Mannheimia haemolytica D174]AGR74520.1 hypothetical protein N220_03865 [Mannheimia haemolytica USMARC_2286]EPZ00789.1 hypothetical protein L279_13465 [Mannheimia haemolytica D38]EPZ24117
MRILSTNATNNVVLITQFHKSPQKNRHTSGAFLPFFCKFADDETGFRIRPKSPE